MKNIFFKLHHNSFETTKVRSLSDFVFLYFKDKNPKFYDVHYELKEFKNISGGISANIGNNEAGVVSGFHRRQKCYRLERCVNIFSVFI